MFKLKHLKQTNKRKEQKFLTLNNLDVVDEFYFTFLAALSGTLLLLLVSVAIKDLNWADKLINHISRWISFDIARPLLDKMPYVVLSDFANLQNGELSPPDVSNNVKEVQYDDIHQDSNDPFMCEDEEMIDHEYESLSDESDTESTGLRSIEIEDGDISNILIGLKGSHLRYKVCVSQCRCIDDSVAAYNFDY